MKHFSRYCKTQMETFDVESTKSDKIVEASDKIEKSEEVAVMMATSIYCLLFFALPIPIISLIVAVNNMSDPCLSSKIIGLNLSQWLMGSGIGGIISITILITLLILNYAFTSEHFAVAVVISTIFIAVFNFIYSIIGSIILFAGNLTCLTHGTEIGIMSLIILIMYWFSVLARCCRQL